MANAVSRNVVYIDTGAGATVTVDAVQPIIQGILITPSADSSHVILKESNGGTVVFELKIVPTESRYIDCTKWAGGGIMVSSTFEVDTLTNISSVILYGNWLQPVGRAK